VSSTSATFASAGGSCSRCWRRSAAWAPRRDLPRVQLREPGRRGLGHRDVDRHGVRAGIAHAVRPAGSGPPAGVHAHGRHRGRLARASRDRARLQRLDRRRAADLGGRPVRGGAGDAARAQAAARAAVLRARQRDVGRRARVGHRAAGGGPRVWAPGVGHARRPLGPRARRKALPRVPRAAHAGAPRVAARASGPRSRPTSACSSSITRGRAT
jgi:hypothetical protein